MLSAPLSSMQATNHDKSGFYRAVCNRYQGVIHYTLVAVARAIALQSEPGWRMPVNILMVAELSLSQEVLC